MSTDIGGDTVLERLPEVIWREMAGETVLLDPAGSVLMGLNESAGRMWELIDGVRSLQSLAEELAGHYGQPEDKILADLIVFAQALLEAEVARIL